MPCKMKRFEKFPGQEYIMPLIRITMGPEMVEKTSPCTGDVQIRNRRKNRIHEIGKTVFSYNGEEKRDGTNCCHL